MTALDLIVLAVIALSVMFAYFRGVVREVVALAAWIVGLVAAFRYMDQVATIFAGLDVTPAVRHVLAFVLILVVFMIAGALVAWILRSAVRAVGLGFVDRFLGALFGVARGALIAVLFALIAGVTPLPRLDWWQNSLVGPVRRRLCDTPYDDKISLAVNASPTLMLRSGRAAASWGVLSSYVWYPARYWIVQCVRP
jgi:membrane protein required for colicin V production